MNQKQVLVWKAVPKLNNGEPKSGIIDGVVKYTKTGIAKRGRRVCRQAISKPWVLLKNVGYDVDAFARRHDLDSGIVFQVKQMPVSGNNE